MQTQVQKMDYATGAKAKENEKDFDKEFTKFKFNLELEKIII